jgi:replication-associated recombination protein RarA
MTLRGLQHVKNIALELHTRVMAERKLPPEMRVKTSLNFSLMGNPGTGKTTVAKLLGQLLHELGLRSSTTFKSTSGEDMAREGAREAANLIAQADNGVLFIDEAYQLDPAKSSEGKAIVNQLLTAAEEKRETLTIIFAGYKDDTEEKLYAFSPGFKSRFQQSLSASDGH